MCHRPRACGRCQISFRVLLALPCRWNLGVGSIAWYGTRGTYIGDIVVVALHVLEAALLRRSDIPVLSMGSVGLVVNGDCFLGGLYSLWSKEIQLKDLPECNNGLGRGEFCTCNNGVGFRVAGHRQHRRMSR